MRRSPLAVLVPTAVLALVAPLAAVVGGPAQADDPAPRTSSTADRAAPGLRVTTRLDNLSHPWDVKELPSGSLLVTERSPARLTLRTAGGTRRTISFPTSRIWTSGETGLMGLALDREFYKNRRFYTCSGWQGSGGSHDIRVVAWALDSAERTATFRKTLLAGLPTTSGRHGGCRLLFTRTGELLVGTGDAADEDNPQNKYSLGGKTLRLDPHTGKPSPGNPYIRSANVKARYVLTYGHRNVQGLAQRNDGSLWSVEHGTGRDDEVNRIVKGGNYGWQPGPGYDESRPMTDQSLPGTQIEAKWSSGSPTVATSGATFVGGSRWGSYNGGLFVAALGGQRLFVMKFYSTGKLASVSTPSALNGTYGRLRTVTQLRNGDVVVATDGADGAGRILLVRPS